MSTMIESLAQTRHAERYHSLQSPTDRVQTITRRQDARSRAGWLLIGFGLHLVTRSGEPPARRASLLGQ